MKKKAYCPGHISSIFRVCAHKNPLQSGSRGAGIVIEEGVITEIETNVGLGISVFFNGKAMDLRPSKVMAAKMTEEKNMTIRHTTKLPIGAGFGVSAACAMGVGLCLNSILSKDMTLTEIREKAHLTEIECETGLGDVAPMLKGGIEQRITEGIHGHIENIKQETCNLACFSYGPVDTKKALKGDKIKKLNTMADILLEKLSMEPSFSNFISCSKEFSQKSGFSTKRLDETLEKLNALKGVHASQTMLGESGFAFYQDDMNKKLHDTLKDAGTAFITKVGYRPPGLIQ